MNIVMPMAGRGSRFAEIGISTPKPLIDVLGRPMYAWAMESLPLELARRVIFICLEEHLRDQSLEADIRSRYGRLDPEIVRLDAVTEGQACTVLMAGRWIDNDEPLLVYNADTYCRTRLAQRLPALPADVDGLVGVFQAPGDKWSFARADASGRVLEMAEKNRISDWASTGLYYFRRGRDFVRHAEAMIAANDRVGKEFYVAPVYNRLIAAGGHVVIDPADAVWVLGTPEDLKHFQTQFAPWYEATQRNSTFPDFVTLHVSGPNPAGLAVSLCFEMSRKNNFTYTVFLNPEGCVEVPGKELLYWFDEEASNFIMDYQNPRVVFTGRVTARVLSTEELHGAVKAFQMFHRHIPYPPGYEENLNAAMARGQNPDEYRLDLEVKYPA